jgi:hypothetical protein
MSERQPSLNEFLKDVETHQMKIRLDHGIYRYIECRRADGSFHHCFHIITAPHTLLVRGDMGAVSFSRVEDMFTFFASDPAKINPSYWSEKVETLHGSSVDVARRFVGDLFKEELIEDLDGYDLAGDRKARLIKELEGAIEWCDDESYVRRQVNDFEHDGFAFSDTEELSGKGFIYRYIWLIRAICWAIGQYERQKAATAAAPVDGSNA